ncbi:uncharacterized protein FIBRA_02642 [Fibroporia radiculosa]|uniref:HMG box domain-containing protein n=1 Tax=Fibroporia radiculosa TaxID=599839 RepID=J4I962_9APHY|nr:uncharacterized protein FIBRA_02642 [Fibroporia radiculosa]CCM00606.1 predicted protein [Fibroporia radiculosa]
MAGASRRSSPSSSSRPSPMGVQPPRPQNAWILYRSDKLREMMQRQTESGQPKKAQADVSKEVALLWKTESPAVRAEYERLAEMKKLEHQTKYPGYKFQPMKKEDKARMRQLKKEEKERARDEARKGKARLTPYTQPYYSATPNQIPYYTLDGCYDPAGPSPPMSAASTPSPCPSPSSSSSELASGSAETDPQPATYAFVAPLQPPSSSTSPPQPSSSQQPLMNTMPPPPEIVVTQPDPPLPSPPQHLESSAQAAWSILPVPQMETQQGHVPMDTGENESGLPAGWALDAQESGLPPQFMPNGQPQQFLTFEIPWEGPGLDNSTENDQSFAPLMAAGGPEVWQLSGFDEDMFMLDPPGEIDLAMGQITQLTEGEAELQRQQFAQFLANFDFSQLPSGLDVFPAPAPQPPQQDVFEMSDDQGRPRSVTQESFMQFLNLDASFVAPLQEQTIQPAMLHAEPQPPTTSSPSSSATGSSQYVPPSGAANASMRRVAGSWKPAPELEPVAESPHFSQPGLWPH